MLKNLAFVEGIFLAFHALYLDRYFIDRSLVFNKRNLYPMFTDKSGIRRRI